MSDAITKIGQNAWLWRAIIFKGANGYLIAVAATLLGAHVFTPYQESIIAAVIAGSKFLDGFMNQDLARVKQEMAQAFGFSTGNTQQFYPQAGAAMPQPPVAPPEPKG